jgi:hypothetical protein
MRSAEEESDRMAKIIRQKTKPVQNIYIVQMKKK